jgi:DNA-binding HxlR family transcriptional regulator
MRPDQRSTCPISTALELVGDRWTLLVIRDLMFAGKRHFREFLQSEEAISSNVLADRLNSLVENGIVTRRDDPTHSQKAIYSLTDKGLGLRRYSLQ